MMDIYRSYYGLSGEPFRLGPDHRFSLNHPSYATAKAYLTYAIYQGEGFVAITGAPGTGKTTLISEILAGLDRHKIGVATLSSTQVESRDLLQMVASSFGLNPAKVEIPDLLAEIESHLVSKVRSGHRAILIVDEAQGLSSGALEELRLLANLQYQYQLLLQICLVGQESLLKLIRSPGMEHLQQRLVAAAPLEPLTFDESIDYIEHRLTRVAWKGDPSIDERALRLIYQFSGGIPRRINLICNRLFLYGGTRQKHQFVEADVRVVIDGMIEEFLLQPEPAIEESAIEAQQSAGDAKEAARVRSLPRPGVGTPGQQAAAGESEASKPAANRDADEEATRVNSSLAQKQSGQSRQANFKLDSNDMPGSQPRSRVPEKAAAKAPPPPSENKARRQVAFAASADGVPVATAQESHDHRRVGRGFYLVALALAGAAGAYLLGGKSVNLNGLYSFTKPGAPGTVVPAAPESTQGEPVTTDTVPAAEVPASGSETAVAPQPEEAQADVAAPQAADSGRIERETAAQSTPTAVAPAAQPVPESTARPKASPVVSAVAAKGDEQDGSSGAGGTPANTGEQSKAPASPPPQVVAQGDGAPEAPAPTSRATPPEPAAGTESEPQASATAKAQTAPQPKPAPSPKAQRESASDPVENERARLRKAAEQRFSQQIASVGSDVSTAPAPAAATVVKAKPSSAPAPTTVAKAEPQAAMSHAKRAETTAEAVKKALLDGRWSSSGKPASLLPSDTTYCTSRVGEITCLSVPQNVKTQYGLALYKVETTLNGFSADGLFEMSYRTLVRLVSSQSAKGGSAASGAGNDGWQVSNYAMSCTLTGGSEVSCVDGKGITRRYQRSGARR